MIVIVGLMCFLQPPPVQMYFVNRYGLQTEKGTGALIQPILAWGQIMEKGWGIFHEVFDWNVSSDPAGRLDALLLNNSWRLTVAVCCNALVVPE